MAKLANNATRLLEAIDYQLIVTLEHCFDLVEGQTLWLEVFGDVTVSDSVQVEVKSFIDDLTDGHINFWNTLKNWLAPKFKHEKYAELILLTTQTYGATAELRHWNDLSGEKRLALLTKVLVSSEARVADSGKQLSKAIKTQKFVMSYERRPLLLEIIEKIKIVSDEPGLKARAVDAKSRFGKGIEQSKRDEYFQSLLGYLIEPCLEKNGWKVTYDDFGNKIARLFSRYGQHSREFPVVDSDIFNGEDKSGYADRLFVKKLHEIEYADIVPSAILEHMVAVHTITQEFKRFTVEKVDLENYKHDQLKRHRSLRSVEMRRCFRKPREEWCLASQDFFDARCGEPVDGMPTFDGTSVEFRNGIWHMLADDEDEEGKEKLHWRLW